MLFFKNFQENTSEYTVKKQKTGIILLNMGGPDSQDDVAPFLYNLFSDREIIRLGPPLLQKPLAWFISRRRAPKSRSIYQKIGGGSPLLKITRQQASALQENLRKKGDFVVTVAMRYWPPFADEAVKFLLKEKVDSITALTLYPHYSKATTGSSVIHLKKSLNLLAPHIPLKVISSYPTQPSYIKSLADTVMAGCLDMRAKFVRDVN